MIRAPQLLIAFRAACAPALFALACFGLNGLLLAAVVLAAAISDIFDGVIARRTGVATAAIRTADTVVDTIFYACAGVSLQVAVPGVFHGSWTPLLLVIVIHVSRTTFELTKFGRLAAYHMWSSKALGLLLAVALMVTFATGAPTPLLPWALWLGVANELEGFTASLLLPVWRADVPTLIHAVRISLDTK